MGGFGEPQLLTIVTFLPFATALALLLTGTRLPDSLWRSIGLASSSGPIPA